MSPLWQLDVDGDGLLDFNELSDAVFVRASEAAVIGGVTPRGKPSEIVTRLARAAADQARRAQTDAQKEVSALRSPRWSPALEERAGPKVPAAAPTATVGVQQQATRAAKVHPRADVTKPTGEDEKSWRLQAEERIRELEEQVRRLQAES